MIPNLKIFYATAGVQLTTSPITRGYRKLCGAIIIFGFIAQLAIRKVTF